MITGNFGAMTLKEIERRIKAIEAKPSDEWTPNDASNLKELRYHRRMINNARYGGGA